MAWLGEAAQQARLLRSDGDNALLAVGPLVVARATLRPVASLSRAQFPDQPVAATLVPAPPREAGWHVRGVVEYDEECSLELDQELRAGPADAHAISAATALATFGLAQAAGEAAQFERAVELAERALHELGLPDEQPTLTATITAFAIERLVDQRQLGRAQQLALATRPQLATKLDPGQPAALRFALAAARLLDWPGALAERRSLQPILVATFGERGVPSLENRVRTASALLVLGRGAAALDEFVALEVIVGADPRPVPALRLLLARSHARALALLGRQDTQLARLHELRAELARRYGEDDRRVVDVDDDLARGLADAARLPEALALASRVYLWRDRALGTEHARTQETAQLLALLYGRSGRYGTARALLEDLLQRIDPEGDADLTLRSRRDLATWAALDGEPRAALDLMGQAYQAVRTRYSSDSIYAVALAIDYGWLLLRAGETAQACAMLDSVRERTPATQGLREWADAGYARCLLARSKDPGDTRQALALLAGAVAAATAAVGADNPRTLVWQSLLAGAELRAGRRAEAKRRLIEFVYRAERSRDAMAAGATVRDSTFALWIAESDSMAGYRTLALLHAQDGEFDDALRVAELARDRQLRERFAQRRWLQLPAGLAQSARLRALQAQRQRLDEAIAVADVPGRVRLEAQRFAVTQAADRLERALAQQFPDAASSVTPTVAALQARLTPDTALLAYQRAGDAWWITLIDAHSATVLPVPDGVHVAVAAQAWARAVRGEPVRVWQLAGGRWVLAFVRPTQDARRVAAADLAQRLGAALFGPLGGHVANVHRLVVVADDELIGLPLDALAFDAGGALAVAHLDFTYAASFAGWIELQDRARRSSWQRDLLALGAIDYAASGAAPASAGGATQRSDVWTPLSFAREELARIARGFAPDRVRELTDGAATKEALASASRSGELARYRYVHFATHASVERAFSERASLVLSGATPGGIAYLTATELAGLAMNAELVVLSACDTGVGRYEQGQGLLGFAFAVLAAGNRGALLSLWPVADETTARFMGGFYARLRAGLAPSLALAATKREFIASSNPRERDPRVWAAFLLYGAS